jgi:hypothetical protein
MHAGRRVSYRLILALAVSAGMSACASDRYIGSIGRDGTYVNRGYGFAVLLTKIEDRWNVPDQVNGFDSPIDVDGDGLMELDETRHIRRPTLKLESKTSSASITIDVTILGKNNRNASFDGLALLELAKLASTSTTSSAAPSFEIRKLGGFPVRVAELPEYRLALIDVEDFIAEENQTRRQIIKVLLRAKEITAGLRRDFDEVLGAMILNRKGGTETAQEKW